MKFLLCSLFIVFPLFSSVASTTTTDYSLFTEQLLGEVGNQNYTGALDPRITIQPSYLNDDFKDAIEWEQYGNELIQASLFDLSDYWLKEAHPQLSCPNGVLTGNIDYIHYLYRLIAISYLQEALREYAVASLQMGVNASNCSLDWEKSFALCSPKSIEMKKFLRRIKGRHTMGMDMKRMVRLSKAQTAQQLTLFNQHLLEGKLSSIVERRLSYIFTEKNPVDIDKFGEGIDTACKQDKRVVLQLCSEVDDYFGFSEVGIFTYLLQKSNAISVINEGGYGEGCISRFSRLNSKKEMKLDYLLPLSEALFEQIRSSNLRYKQGSLFVAGALKEFDDKGLEDFIYAEKKKEEPKPVEVVPAPVVVAVAPAPAPAPEPEIVYEPEIPAPAPTPVVIEEVKISQFEQQLKKMDDNPSLEQAALDMGKFKDDFVFSPLMVEALREPLQDFQSRQGLEDMALGDKLGTAQEPVQLIFLKFLIDNNLHTGLFNVVAVLGEKFYVRNDIDGKKRAVLIELKNDESTGFRWQITLVRPKAVAAVATPKK